MQTAYEVKAVQGIARPLFAGRGGGGGGGSPDVTERPLFASPLYASPAEIDECMEHFVGEAPPPPMLL